MIKVEERPLPRRRYFVKVRADFDFDGRIIPLMFRTQQGRIMRIDRVLDVRRAPSLKAGGLGIRYTIRVEDRLFFLFHDQTNWFIESI